MSGQETSAQETSLQDTSAQETRLELRSAQKSESHETESQETLPLAMSYQLTPSKTGALGSAASLTRKRLSALFGFGGSLHPPAGEPWKSSL